MAAHRSALADMLREYYAVALDRPGVPAWKRKKAGAVRDSGPTRLRPFVRHGGMG